MYEGFLFLKTLMASIPIFVLPTPAAPDNINKFFDL
jgi:hypothetical protein